MTGLILSLLLPRSFRFWILLSIAGFSLNCLGEGEFPSPPGANTLNYRDILQCGPNSLFMFSIMCGHPEVNLDKLHDLPYTKEGISFLELRQAARKYNLNTEIRHYAPGDIDRVPLPAIGQFSLGFESTIYRHFDVIYKVDSNYVYILDGTTGRPDRFRRQKLAQFWSGYAMVKENPRFTVGNLLITALLLWNCYFFGFLVHKKSAKQPRR